MMKPLKIFFIGRKHGVIPFRARAWKLEKQRRGELEGFNATRGLVRTYSPKRADVIFVRNMQEYTQEKDIRNIEKRIGRYRGKKLILNDIECFRNYNSKELTLAIWQKNNLPVPDFKVLDLTTDESGMIKEVKGFLAQHSCMILRSTNDECGLGMFFIDDRMDDNQITAKVRECRAYLVERKGLRTDGGLMMVEYIGDCQKPVYQYLGRAYCVGEKIVSFRCITGKQQNLHAKSMVPDDLDEFVEMNYRFSHILKEEPYRSQIIKAVECLGVRMTAIDFIYKDNAIYFLEANPMWGGGSKYGDAAFMELLKQQRTDLLPRIPNIYELLDGATFYNRFYEVIQEYTRQYYS